MFLGQGRRGSRGDGKWGKEKGAEEGVTQRFRERLGRKRQTEGQGGRVSARGRERKRGSREFRGENRSDTSTF